LAGSGINVFLCVDIDRLQFATARVVTQFCV
jgi:hypothetical protein